MPNDKFVLTANEIVAVPLYDSTKVFPDLEIELSVLKVNTYQIKTIAADGYTTQTYTINVIREKSSDSTLKKLAVSGYEIEPEFDSQVLEYKLKLPKEVISLKAEDVIAIPTDQYATVVKQGDLHLTSGNNIFNIDVTSHDGSTHTNYKIIVETAKSDNNYLESLTASSGVLSPEFDKKEVQYTLTLSEWEDSVTIDAVPEDITAKVISGTGTYSIPNGGSKHVLVMCQAEDETLRAYIVDIQRAPKTETRIIGRIITENVYNTHTATVSLYKEDSLVTSVNTEEDGSYELHVIPDTYKLIVEKEGYLPYTVDNIEITNIYDEVNINEYYLIAGDVVKTGEIELDDLVWFNKYFGHEIDEENRIYDFNEDDIIDEKDRKILVKNYGKLAEVLNWKHQDVEETESLEDDIQDEELVSDEDITKETQEDVQKSYITVKDDKSNLLEEIKVVEDKTLENITPIKKKDEEEPESII